MLVPYLHRGPHARGDGLCLFQGALDPGDVLQRSVDEPLAETAHVGRAETVDVRGERTSAPEPAQHLEDDRGLSDPARTRDEHVIPVAQTLHQAADVGLAANEIRCGHRPANGKVGRGSTHATERTAIRRIYM